MAAASAFAARSTFRADPEYLIDTWETEDGLPENSATAMAQTPDGYLWFGSFRGLVRFDGMKFTVFNPANTPQLPSASIVNVYADQRGYLWVSTYLGLAVFDGTQWRSFTKTNGWTGDFVRTFTGRPNGDLLMTTFDGRVIEIASGRLAELPAPPGTHGAGYFGYADESGHWWAVQDQLVARWDGQRWADALPKAKLESPVSGARGARDGGLWLVFERELRKYRAGAEVNRVPLMQSFGGFWSVFEDSQTNAWISTHDRGLYRVSLSGEIRRWTTTNGLSYDGVRFVFEDREQNIWVGTSGGGLMRFKPRRVWSFGQESGLEERNVTSLSAGLSDSVWIATYGRGLFRWHQNKITVFPGTDWKGAKCYVQSVFTDRSGRTWAGTMNQGLWLFEGESVREIPKDGERGDNIISIFEDSRGRIWLGDGAGVTMCESNRFRTFRTKEGLPKGGVRCFEEDASGVVWVCNESGVFRFFAGRFVEVHNSTNGSILEITCLKADADGSMWMGSLHESLLRWRQGQIDQVDVRSGFPVTAVYGILEDAHGVFWMPSERGIVRADRKQLQAAAKGGAAHSRYQLIDASDGLPGMEMSTGRQPLFAKDGQGRLWFATQKGVAMIDPAQFRTNSLPPPVIIEQVVYRIPPRRVGGSSRLQGHVVPFTRTMREKEAEIRLLAPFREPLQLPAGSRQIEIHYTALNFTAPEKARFQTRLEGRGHDWDDVGQRRVARFFESRPGTLNFRVRAANHDGVWNEEGASLALVIQPYFWQSWWFRIASGITLLAAGAAAAWLAARAKLRRSEERERAAEAIHEMQERMDLAADAAHLGMWVWDIPQQRLWASASCKRLLGYASNADLTLEMFWDRVHPEDRAAREAAIERAMAKNSHYNIEYRILLPDGTIRWIAGSGRVERDGQGTPTRMTGVSIDITQRKEAERDTREVSGKLITAQEDERKRLARDLHDDLNQRLALLSVEMELLGQMPAGNYDLSHQRIGEIAKRVKEMSSEVHILSYQLHPAKLDQLGLVSAVRSFCRELSRQSGMPVEFLHDDVPSNLGSDLALCFYRIIQESLQNVVKHSQASKARVELRMANEQLRLVVSDDGKGFDLESAAHKTGLGLVGMRERVRLVRGDIVIRSAPGRGTRVELSAPVSMNESIP